MTPLKQLFRLIGIFTVLIRYRLDDLITLPPPLRALGFFRFLLPRPASTANFSLGTRLRLALTELGPIFIKFGQILSTRRDLLPADIAEELALLQDQVEPFPGTEARRIVENALKEPIDTSYKNFDLHPLASASISQVHAAQLPDGREVVVKVLRPGIERRIDADTRLLRALGNLVQRYHPAADKIRPQEVVSEIETTLRNELDLQREGANASVLRRNFLGSDDLLVPEVYWSHTAINVLTLERVYGIRADDLTALNTAGIDRLKLAEKGIRLFYTQVFRDNFFHADAHPGNIWVDPTRPDNPRYIALDFGIMGSLPRADQYWLAENFMALFNCDYQRMAQLHVEAGWMPAHVRLDELEAAMRTVCEPYFTRPLSEISLGEVLMKIFVVVRRYELTLQPQLILLQKTLLNIDGMGRYLHPKIDIWATAKPVLTNILRDRYRLKSIAKQWRSRIPEWLITTPEVPQLVHDYLKKLVAGELTVRISSEDLQKLTATSQANQHLLIRTLLGSTLILSAAVLYALDIHGPKLFQLPLSALVSALAGGMAFFAKQSR